MLIRRGHLEETQTGEFISEWRRNDLTAPPSTVFDFVWSKVKNMVGVAGMSREEARFWHRQVYSGMVGDSHDGIAL